MLACGKHFHRLFFKKFCETNPWLSSAPCLFKPTKQNEFLPHQFWLIISHKDQSGRTSEWYGWFFTTTRRVIVYLLSERMEEKNTFCRFCFCNFNFIRWHSYSVACKEYPSCTPIVTHYTSIHSDHSNHGVPDPWHIGVDPDPDPQIHASA